MTSNNNNNNTTTNTKEFNCEDSDQCSVGLDPQPIAECETSVGTAASQHTPYTVHRVCSTCNTTATPTPAPVKKNCKAVGHIRAS